MASVLKQPSKSPSGGGEKGKSKKKTVTSRGFTNQTLKRLNWALELCRQRIHEAQTKSRLWIYVKPFPRPAKSPWLPEGLGRMNPAIQGAQEVPCGLGRNSWFAQATFLLICLYTPTFLWQGEDRELLPGDVLAVQQCCRQWRTPSTRSSGTEQSRHAEKTGFNQSLSPQQQQAAAT